MSALKVKHKALLQCTTNTFYSPQNKTKENTWHYSHSSWKWLNLLFMEGKKSGSETSRQVCENFAPSSTRDACQRACSSSAFSSNFTHSPCSFLGKQRSVDCRQQERWTVSDPHGQGAGPTTTYSTYHHQRLSDSDELDWKLPNYL